VERQIQPGLTRLNWNSLSVEEYSRDCQQVLKDLASLVAQMGKIGEEVQTLIDCLERFNFFYFDKPEEVPARVSSAVNVPNITYRKIRPNRIWCFRCQIDLPFCKNIFD
jgi:hypothetical protein